jgi:lipopolysaccharide transport system permease protein
MSELIDMAERADALLQEPQGDAASVPGRSRESTAANKLTIIQPRCGWVRFDTQELWESRELLYFLTWRDIKVRYKQTVLGAAWAILQPLLTMLVFTIFFGRLAKLPSDGIAYPVFAYAGLLPWTFFANSVTLSGQSLVNQQHLLTKVYFPRVFVPAAPVAAGLVDLFLAGTVLAVMMVLYNVVPTGLLVLVPLLILVTAASALGVGLLLAALTVTYRDFRYVIPFLVQIWLFCTPVVYPVSIVPERWQWLLALNPMGGVVTASRAALVNGPMNWNHLAISSSVAVGLLIFGAAYFRRTERRFADIA